MFFGWAGKGGSSFGKVVALETFFKKRKGRGNFTEVKPILFWGKLFHFGSILFASPF